jgi:hypothetical protein
MEGDAIQHIGREANDIAEAVAAELREVNAGAHSHRNTQNAGQGEDERGTDDRIGHPAARFAHRFRGLGEEGPVDRPDTSVNKIGEYREQRYQHQDDGKHRHAGHDVVGEPAPQSDGRDGVEHGIFVSFRHEHSQTGHG